MRIKLTLLASLVNSILLVCAAAQSPSSDQDKVKAFLDQVNRPVVYSIPAMDQAKVKRDIAYKKDASADFLRMDLYLPPDTKGVLPVVILIHGGVYSDVPLKPKDWGFYKSWGRLIAASGMAAVTFNQRLGFPDPNLKQAAQDVEDLIGFVRAHSDDWGLDRDRICLAAYSAGGPMLSMAMRDAPPYIRCLVGFYPFLDIQQSALHRKFLSAQQLKEFSPITYLDHGAAKLPPMFVARAGRDQIPDLEPGLDRFVAEAVHRNIALEFLNHPFGVHGFDSQNDDAASREIITAAIEFIETHLAEP
ncbi:MAG: alpha/beta hydrolase [Candidatus Sulfotelmatobacter sp.]